jgi:hypothetical protein
VTEDLQDVFDTSFKTWCGQEPRKNSPQALVELRSRITSYNNDHDVFISCREAARFANNYESKNLTDVVLTPQKPAPIDQSDTHGDCWKHGSSECLGFVIFRKGTAIA